MVNDAFYNASGFFTVGSYFLGDQNPQWTKKPVQVQVVSICFQKTRVWILEIYTLYIDGQRAQNRAWETSEQSGHKKIDGDNSILVFQYRGMKETELS